MGKEKMRSFKRYYFLTQPIELTVSVPEEDLEDMDMDEIEEYLIDEGFFDEAAANFMRTTHGEIEPDYDEPIEEI